MAAELANKITQEDELRFCTEILREVILLEKVEVESRARGKGERDVKTLKNVISDIFNKKQLCVLVGAAHTGKKHLMMEVYKTVGIS